MYYLSLHYLYRPKGFAFDTSMVTESGSDTLYWPDNAISTATEDILFVNSNAECFRGLKSNQIQTTTNTAESNGITCA